MWWTWPPTPTQFSSLARYGVVSYPLKPSNTTVLHVLDRWDKNLDGSYKPAAVDVRWTRQTTAAITTRMNLRSA